ncbi:hypothetical protein [Roseibium litorale]
MSMDNTVIHVRFAPNGSVVEIGERPESLSPQQWFNWLSLNVPAQYRVLAGGRGVFTVASGEVEMLQKTSMAS